MAQDGLFKLIVDCSRKHHPASRVSSSHHLIIEGMGSLSFQKASILWLWIISMFYGSHIALFVAASYILSSRWRTSKTQMILFILIIVLFIMSTAAVVLAFTEAFMTVNVLVNNRGYPGETEAVLRAKEISNLLDCLISLIANVFNVIADGLTIWRCYIICHRWFTVVAIPIELLVVALGCIELILNMFIYKLRMAAPPSEILPPPSFPWDEKVVGWSHIGFLIASAILNLITMTLVGFVLSA
ncbi:hypothetical protein NEOLEDRAFT_931591 [Neolentinus lepideus HHB14362 ss-1]|uniref:Uncharacterized protein n=1 Tax=Neolentinus lepideus HHB14362 ss-1 TaxID=1314782 RepID=A0A165NJL6_9AGAM|nr:hypothetical protein NEOLEDRAFT_931591 [Neolentinus lepideus HHB14362 ss-1]